MKVSIKRESAVPIRDQLIEQIALQIASGTLASGTKLPSIRALASRLDIHFSTVTAAYNHLADVGLLEIKQGSGVKVTKIESTAKLEARKSLPELFGDFLALAAQSGYSFEEVQALSKEMQNRARVSRVLVVDRNRDFHPIILTELAPQLALPVEAATVAEVRENQSLLDNSLIVTSLYHLFSFEGLVIDKTRLLPCNIEPARLEMEKINTLPSGSLLMLVSVSDTLLAMATKLVAASRGEEVALRSINSKEKNELEYSLGYADLVICDRPSYPDIEKIVEKSKLAVFSLYSASTIETIQERLRLWG